MKRIVIDARESGTSTGRYVDKLIEHLHKIGTPYEVVVLTKQKQISFIKSIAPSFGVVNSPFKEFTFQEQIGLLKQIRSFKPDLVHFAMVQQPILYLGKVVTTMHDLTTLRFDNPAKNIVVFRFKQFVYAGVNKLVTRKSLNIITPSEYVKADIIDYSHIKSPKFVVTYEAADKIKESSVPIASLKAKKFIFYVGRPLPHKNLKRLIESFKIITASEPNLILVFAGNKDSLYQDIEKLVKDQQINNIVFTGFVSEGQLRWLYENCRAYVFPSLSEGFGLPGIEAMMHGAPVISSKATCLPEIYGNAAEYFDPLNINDIATTILKVINDDQLRQKLISLGYSQANKYSWERMAKQTLQVYQSILE